ncbi:hypothetical protein [Bradyrhizobium sp.]
MSYLFVSHDLNVVRLLRDRVIWSMIRKGMPSDSTQGIMRQEG